MELVNLELTDLLEIVTPRLEELFDQLLECNEGLADQLVELATEFAQEVLELVPQELEAFLNNAVELVQESGVLEDLESVLEGLDKLFEMFEEGIEAFLELPPHEQIRLTAVLACLVFCPELLIEHPELLKPLLIENNNA